MKIYYRYNGFIRSSELNLIENIEEEEFRETFVLLGEFGEEIYDLFGIVLVEKSWNSSDMSYNISGFDKTGNGNLGYYEGQTLQVLYNIFKESWDYIQTEEEALEQLDISVERLDIEVVPNPDKLNDKDDLYTYLDPSQRIIKSCSRVKVKVPAPNIECIPVSINMINTAPESEYLEPATKLTMSKNNGPKFTIDTYFSGSPEDPDFEDNIAAYQKKLVEAMYLAEDKTSMAFIPSMFVNSITTERVTENLCGLTSQGLLLYDDNLYSLNDGFYDMRDVFNPSSPPSLKVPLNIVSETTTVNFYPTVGLPKEKDSYYMFEGSDDLGTPVTVISCAKIVSSEPVIDCIPTAAEYIGPSIILTPMKATVSVNGGPRITDYFSSILQNLSLTPESSGESGFWLGSRQTENGVNTTIISGFDSNGNSYNPEGSILNTKSEISDLTGKVLTINENQNSVLEIYPTPNAGFGLDCYDHFSGGDDFGTPITIISCAKVLSEEVISFGKRIRVTTGTDHIKSDNLYTYTPEDEGSNGEKVVNISNLFADSSFDADGKLIGRNDGWSDWSAPIDFSDINHVMSNGGLTIISNPNVTANSWIDMTNVSNVELFAQELKNNIYGSNLEYKDFG